MKILLSTTLLVVLLSLASCAHRTQDINRITLQNEDFLLSKSFEDQKTYLSNEDSSIEINTYHFNSEIDAMDFFYKKRLFIQKKFELVPSPYLLLNQDRRCLKESSLEALLSEYKGMKTFYVILPLDLNKELNYCRVETFFVSRVDLFLEKNKVIQVNLTVPKKSKINITESNIPQSYLNIF